MLRRVIPLLREECLRCLEVTTTVLQLCAAAGLTLFEIGSLMTRPDSLGPAVPSDLEVMCMDAREEALAAGSPQMHSGAAAAFLSPRSAHGGSAAASALALPAWTEEEEEEGVFELEGDGNSGLANLSDDGSSARLGSPPSSFESPPAGLRRDGSLPGCFHTAPPRHCFLEGGRAAASASPAIPRYTSSFAGGDEAARATAKHSERRMWRHKRRVAYAYPPPISGDHPDLVNYVFSGLTPPQWRVFMAAVREWCEEELAAGTWRAATGHTAVAGSCPVFSHA